MQTYSKSRFRSKEVKLSDSYALNTDHHCTSVSSKLHEMPTLGERFPSEDPLKPTPEAHLSDIGRGDVLKMTVGCRVGKQLD